MKEKMLKVVRSGVEQGRKPPQTILVTATVTSDLANAIDTHFPVCWAVASFMAGHSSDDFE